MGFGQIAGTLLEGLGPGLASQAGKILTGGDSPDKKPPAPPEPSKVSTAVPNKFKHGGVVKKTGLALVHEGEVVVPKHKVEEVKLSQHRVVMHLRKGGLHRALGIPEGETIPKDKLEAARNSKNPHVRAMANLAHTMEGWHHGG